MKLQPSTWVTLITTVACLFIGTLLICLNPISLNRMVRPPVDSEAVIREKQELDEMAKDLGVDLPPEGIGLQEAQILHDNPHFQELKGEIQEEIRLRKLRNAPIRVEGAYYPEEAGSSASASSSPPLLAFAVAGLGGLLVIVIIAGAFALFYLRQPVVVEASPEEEA